MPELPSIRDAVAFGTEVLKSRGAILGLYASVRDYFRKTTEPGERPILILGPGGVGKTTLARILATDYHWIADPVGPYTESLGVEKTVLTASPGVEVVTAPGQPERQRAEWDDLLGQLATGEFRGVVLLTAGGYHSLPNRTAYRDHPLYQGSRDRFLVDYLASCSAAEAAVLRLLAPHLRVCPTPVWLLVVAAKQDLWVSRQADVVRQYTEGEFAAVLAEVTAARSPQQFRYELTLACLVISTLTDAGGDVLVKNTAGYDQRAQAESLVRLFAVVEHLKSWEGAT